MFTYRGFLLLFMLIKTCFNFVGVCYFLKFGLKTKAVIRATIYKVNNKM